MLLRKIGVVGAGVMGRGVALNLSMFGYKVILLDLSREILENSKQDILKDLRFQGLINPKFKIDNPDKVLSNITFSTEITELEDVDYVIENVVEKWDIKKEVYKNIDQICLPHCVFAVNTSVISITRIAAVTSRPSLVIGIHFMNPVPLKRVVEVIKAYHTSDKTLETTNHLLTAIGKEPIIVNDWPGFVSNRVLMLTVNEAIYLIQDGVADAKKVDKIFKGCFEHKMGPLETADMIGLDTILYSIEMLYESFNDSKYRPCPLLKKMVSAGLLGRKSGQGFYDYKID